MCQPLCPTRIFKLEGPLASQILDRPSLTTQVNKLGSSILQNIKQCGWLCGEPMSVETPGLMTGIAGIG